MTRKRMTFSNTDRDTLNQICESEPVHVGDLVSKDSAKTILWLGWATVDQDGNYRLTRAGRDVYGMLNPAGK